MMLLRMTEGGRLRAKSAADGAAGVRLAVAASIFIASLFALAGEAQAAELPDHRALILTPAPKPEPRLTGPRILGVRPGHPVVHRFTSTGERPIVFDIGALPDGLTLDRSTGQLRGAVAKPGEYRFMIGAKNARGSAEREFRLVVGEGIALTPPLGWNSWNSWAGDVTQENILASAQAMVRTGLVDHGWAYINIDDAWQGGRGPNQAIQPNAKFPDMKGLSREVHSLGLKFGIYSTPFVTSYAGYVGGTADNPAGTGEPPPKAKRPPPYIGRYAFLDADVAQWSEWGVDYLKYDWFPVDVVNTRAMSEALRRAGRDIVFSLSNSAHLVQGADYAAHSNLWRITGDITDTWHLAQPKQNLQGIQNIWDQVSVWRAFSGPGHWADPDMLVVGLVGWGKNLRATRLTPDEQFTHLTLWSLWSAPLLIGCPLEKMDAFTIGLLTNDDVLDVDQDPLGRQAVLVAKDGPLEAWAKPLEGGDYAIGLFNRGEVEMPVRVTWPQLGWTGRGNVRDLWRQKEVGVYADGFATPVRPHGVVLIRVSPAAGKP